MREGEIVVDSQRTANLVNEHRRLWSAMESIRCLQDAADDIANAARQAQDVLAKEPEFDHLPTFVEIDSSWEDELPPCILCRGQVPWADALLMPCAAHEDESEISAVGIIHRSGCPSV